MVRTVFLELTNYCNMNCLFCADHLLTRQRGYMDKELAKKVIDQLGQTCFSGNLITSLMGEPLLHRDFIEILDYSFTAGITTNVITNFLMVPERILPSRLLNLGIDTLCLSYQTPDEESYRQRRTKIPFESYYAKLKEILECVKRDNIRTRRVEIHLLQSFYNYLNVEVLNSQTLVEKSITDIYQILEPQVNRLPAKIRKRIRRFHLGHDYKDSYNIQIAPHVFVVLKRANTWANRLVPNEFKIVPSLKGDCEFFNSSLGVYWDGRCTVCCQDFNGEILIGDLNRESLKDVLNSPYRKRMQQNGEKRILINNFCKVCKGTSEKDGQNISIVKRRGIFKKLTQLSVRAKEKIKDFH